MIEKEVITSNINITSEPQLNCHTTMTGEVNQSVSTKPPESTKEKGVPVSVFHTVTKDTPCDTTDGGYKGSIQTQYNGHQYDSILEASHAVFYNSLDLVNIPHSMSFNITKDEEDKTLEEKLPEWALKNTHRTYGPDTFLPSENASVEIKPSFPTDSEMDRCERVACECYHDIVLMYGDVRPPFAPKREKKRSFTHTD